MRDWLCGYLAFLYIGILWLTGLTIRFYRRVRAIVKC